MINIFGLYSYIDSSNFDLQYQSKLLELKVKKLEQKVKKLEVYLLIIKDSDNCCMTTNKIFSLKCEYFESQICNF